MFGLDLGRRKDGQVKHVFARGHLKPNTNYSRPKRWGGNKRKSIRAKVCAKRGQMRVYEREEETQSSSSFL